MSAQTIPTPHTLIQSKTLPAPADIAAFQRDGHVILRNLLDPAKVAQLREHVLELCKPHQERLRPMKDRDVYGKAFVQVMHLWEKDSRLKELSLSPELGKVVSDLFGFSAPGISGAGNSHGRVRIFHDQALLKEPGGGYTPWHQDNWYIPFDTDHILTAWMPLVDCSAAMGTMSFASGSHRSGLHFQGGTSDESNQALEALIHDKGWKISQSGHMHVGDVSFHDGWTIHSAGANLGDKLRESFLIVYYADGARLIERGPWQGAIAGHLPGQKIGDLVGTQTGNPVVWG